jgi:hypothetical protein
MKACGMESLGLLPLMVWPGAPVSNVVRSFVLVRDVGQTLPNQTKFGSDG